MGFPRKSRISIDTMLQIDSGIEVISLFPKANLLSDLSSPIESGNCLIKFPCIKSTSKQLKLHIDSGISLI